MLKLIGSVMIFGSCAALRLNARRELRRRVAAADAMLLALRLMENEITARRTPMPEIIDLLAKNENAVVRQIFSGVRRRVEEAKPPKCFEGLPITLVSAAIVALSFTGFGGLVENIFGG